ncbi:MarR family winged helix-turn-helix transcriptional regulator [Desulfitibacter alkalitolerans]|uniref:MarR family winged helix-turn-helix transcriptional regulator n=1 Tax=Desulfitibacter alkalitolerans TaxID=264641 RepID=UPI0005511678|nr:MarR family transcriptional regulator [Desulfitibacter alkalitolerans]
MKEKNLESLDIQKNLFGNIFLTANRLQSIGDQKLGWEGITIKQWFLTIMILKSGNYSPTLGEVAKDMGYSHQNIKQLALKLRQKGYLILEQDQDDRRVTRLRLTQKCYSFWQERRVEVKGFLTELFQDLSIEDIDSLCKTLDLLYKRVLEMEAGATTIF